MIDVSHDKEPQTDCVVLMPVQNCCCNGTNPEGGLEYCYPGTMVLCKMVVYIEIVILCPAVSKVAKQSLAESLHSLHLIAVIPLESTLCEWQCSYSSLIRVL